MTECAMCTVKIIWVFAACTSGLSGLKMLAEQTLITNQDAVGVLNDETVACICAVLDQDRRYTITDIQ